MADAVTTYYPDDIPTLHNPVSRYNVDEPKNDPKLLLFQCPGGKASGKEVVFQVSPHGKLPMPNADDYNNIDPVTYEGIFYQEQEGFGDFDLQTGGLEDLENDAQSHGELVQDLKDIDMLEKFHAGKVNDNEPPLCDEPPTYYSRDSDSDSENENQANYESDDSR